MSYESRASALHQESASSDDTSDEDGWNFVYVILTHYWIESNMFLISTKIFVTFLS
jgi:hypothetical protein